MDRRYRPADVLVNEAREKLKRFSPRDAFRAMKLGALLVDTRYDRQRIEDGDLPGAINVQSNEIFWRCDPESDYRHPDVSPGSFLIIMCNQGFSSSLAAATLLEMELAVEGVTDVIGGFEAWKMSGLPTIPYKGIS